MAQRGIWSQRGIWLKGHYKGILTYLRWIKVFNFRGIISPKYTKTYRYSHRTIFRCCWEIIRKLAVIRSFCLICTLCLEYLYPQTSIFLWVISTHVGAWLRTHLQEAFPGSRACRRCRCYKCSELAPYFTQKTDLKMLPVNYLWEDITLFSVASLGLGIVPGIMLSAK